MTPALSGGAPNPEVDPGVAPGFDDAFASALNSSAATGEDGQEPADIEQEPENQLETPEQKPEETEPEEEASETADPKPEPEADVTPAGNNKGYYVKKERLNSLTATAKAFEEMRQYAPTVERAKELYEISTEYRELQEDFMSGNPQAIDSVVRWLKGDMANDPRLAERMRSGFVAMAENVPQHLKATSPEAYQRMGDSIIEERIEGLYQKALEAQTAARDDKSRAAAEEAFHHAQLADYQLRGTYRNANEVKPRDPQAERLKQIEDRERAYAERQKRDEDRVWQSLNTRIQSDRDAALAAEIDKALEPAKKGFDEDELEVFRGDILRRVMEDLKGNLAWDRNMALDYVGIERSVRQAIKNGQKSDVSPQAKAYIQEFVAAAQPLIQSRAIKLVNKATQGKLDKSETAHTRLNAGAQKKGGAAPAGSSGRPAGKRPSTMEEAFDAILAGQ